MRIDLATVIGMLGGLAVVLWGIWLGGSFSAFVDMPSIVIVLGGCAAATIIRFNLMNILGALMSAGKISFAPDAPHPTDLIDDIAKVADVMRKSGPLALQDVEVSDPFLLKGIRLISDGYDANYIREHMSRERDLELNRLSEGQRIMKSIGDAAPAFGMIGTLIGLVQMLGSMDDPKKIGPSMAVAILTTLYGAVIQNCICIPLADKLGHRFAESEVNWTLIIDGVIQIRENKSPTAVRDLLMPYLPQHKREDAAEAA